MLKRSLLAVVVALACTGCSSVANLNYNPTGDAQLGSWYTVPTPVSKVTQPKWFNHVLIIVLENGNKKEASGETSKFGSQNYLNTLMSGKGLPDGVKAVNFDNFHGLFHPSYSNYLAMVSGRRIESHLDLQRDLDFLTIADRLKESKLEWRNYAEGYPEIENQCFRVSLFDRDHYVRKHVPFLSFTGVGEASCVEHIVPIKLLKVDNTIAPAERWKIEGGYSAGQFLTSWPKKIQPAYSFYSPNMIHIGHDSEHARGNHTEIEQASNWLQGFIGQLGQPDEKGNASTFWNDTLVVITFDESDQKDPNNTNEIYTVFLGKMVNEQNNKLAYNHFNVLRTIEENFGLDPVGDMDAIAKPITGIWNKP